MRRAGGAGQRDVVEPVLDVQAVLRPGAEAAAGHERCRLCADRPAGDRKWLDAASDFTQKLWQGGELAEALQLGTETLATARRVYGDEDDYTLDAMGRLAAVHSATGDDAAAAHVPAARRRVNGNDHEDDTLGAMSWVAATHHNVGNFVAPLPPTQEALDSTRRTLGSDHISTIIRTGNLGSVHVAAACAADARAEASTSMSIASLAARGWTDWWSVSKTPAWPPAYRSFQQGQSQSPAW